MVENFVRKKCGVEGSIIVDKTDSRASMIFTLQVAPDESQSANLQGAPGTARSETETQKLPSSVLVIDHAAKHSGAAGSNRFAPVLLFDEGSIKIE